MRIAAFNVENLFDRAKALNQETWAAGRPILEAHARANALLQHPAYSSADKTEIVALLGALGLTSSDEGKFVRLRQNHGRLVKRPKTGGVQIVADGRGDWIGWIELTTERVDERATNNAARVITDVNADILGVVEAESRVALKRFTDAALIDGSTARYPHVMLIDGNDDRGIDVGVISKAGFPLGTVRSHVDDVVASEGLFSRDCPEYEVLTPGGERLVVLINHLKSKGYGKQSDSNALRRRQAAKVAEIYQRLIAEGADNIAVLGDLNDIPTSAPLAPLLHDTDLRDISTHPNSDDGGRPGTYANGTKSGKIDYVLLSPALFALTTGGGIFRTGVWGGVNGKLWPIYDTMTKPVHAASDHAAIYADIDLGP